MINYKDFIAEVFDGSAGFNWTSTKNVVTSTSGTLHNYDIKYIFDEYIMSVIISVNETDDRVVARISFTKNGSTNFLNIGSNALKVYSTIVSILRKEIKPYIRKGNSTIHFKAADPRTMNVYRKFAAIIAKELKGKAKITKSGSFEINM